MLGGGWRGRERGWFLRIKFPNDYVVPTIPNILPIMIIKTSLLRWNLALVKFSISFSTARYNLSTNHHIHLPLSTSATSESLYPDPSDPQTPLGLCRKALPSTPPRPFSPT